MLKKRSITIKGHSTSISLEAIFWEALSEIANTQEKSIASLVSEIDTKRSTQEKFGLSSAIRVYILDYFKNK
ncbi:ribbon-helix-helix domain-containing protein [Alphaproteobacteria bacterium]|nr:ribbon-helix-helix domain-containing protein [Alphaproteobacteria bacterium]MBT5798855.1 ribbon-helix-helix domain-containing protein [Alphaproteobacteria bacterium]MDA9190253.1 ribbon-helix-helix domain-containing protein [Alphaproteobacteria bacterium]MDC0394906.1 ribbon-helix-helix domain-containing protein [Alphaproteobacteria bacterium]